MKERLQKVLASRGICSRREAERLIASGEVSVNGESSLRPGTLVDAEIDRIEVYGRRVRAPRPKIYIALHKPRGCVTTSKDPEGRTTVRELVGEIGERIFPVGRLDYHAEGLLLMTNDGELAYALMRPGGVAKTYRVKVKGTPTSDALNRLRRGLVVHGEPFLPVQARLVSKGDTAWLRITLHEGRKNQIVRMMQAPGYPVRRLRRLGVGPLQLGALPAGKWRFLEPSEVAALRRAVAGGGQPRSRNPEMRGAAARRPVLRVTTRRGRAHRGSHANDESSLT